jgi:CheY-like chemotaxis protein
MSPNQRILYFGCYKYMAETRSLMLDHSGYSVVCSTDPEQAVEIVAGGDIALIIFCNSCDDALVGSVTQSVRAISPALPVLRLDPEHSLAWRDPEMLALLIRAMMRSSNATSMGRKPAGSAGRRQAKPSRRA